MGKLLTRNEAAEILGVSRQTIDNWIWQGIFRDKYINGGYYIDSDMITGIFDTVNDISEAKDKLFQIKEKFGKELEEWNKMVEDFKRNLKYASKIKDSLARKEFYHAIIDLVCNNSILSLHTRDIMHRLLEGDDFKIISSYYLLSEERVRQIIHNFIIATKEYIATNNSISENNKLRERINELEGENAQLKTKLTQLYLEINPDDFNLTNEEKRLYDTMFLKIAESPLSPRTKNALLNGNVKLMYDLVLKTEKDLCRINGFGAKCLSEVIDYIKSYGLYLEFDALSIFEKNEKAIRHSELMKKLEFEKL